MTLPVSQGHISSQSQETWITKGNTLVSSVTSELSQQAASLCRSGGVESSPCCRHAWLWGNISSQRSNMNRGGRVPSRLQRHRRHTRWRMCVHSAETEFCSFFFLEQIRSMTSRLCLVSCPHRGLPDFAPCSSFLLFWFLILISDFLCGLWVGPARDKGRRGVFSIRFLTHMLRGCW